jgi:hypothetical protein
MIGKGIRRKFIMSQRATRSHEKTRRMGGAKRNPSGLFETETGHSPDRKRTLREGIEHIEKNQNRNQNQKNEVFAWALGYCLKTITYRDMLVKAPEIASLALRGTK